MVSSQPRDWNWVSFIVLAWRIPGTGEPGGLLSLGSHRVGHDWSDLAAAAAAPSLAGEFFTTQPYTQKKKNFKLKKKTTKSGNSSDSAPRTEKNADLNFMHLRSKQIKYVLHSKQGNGKTLSLIMIFSSFSQDSAIIIGWNPPDSRERWQFLSFSSNSSSVILKSSKSHEVFSKSPVPSLAHRGKDQYKQWWWLHLNQLSMKINDGHRKRGER